MNVLKIALDLIYKEIDLRYTEMDESYVHRGGYSQDSFGSYRTKRWMDLIYTGIR